VRAKLNNKITILLGIFIVTFGSAFADDLVLEARQDPAVMTVTSVELDAIGGTITAVGDMGEYGKVYTTYRMKLDTQRGLYTISGEGRGFLADGSFASGQFNGVGFREGSVFTMYNTVNITGSTQNFDVVTFDALENTLTVKAYVLK
jgi:hypothetical protein